MIAQILLATALVLTPVDDRDKYVYKSPNYYEPVVVAENAKCPQWWHMAVSVGWSKANMEKLDKIMWRESRCDLYAINPKDPMKGSWGLMQVNGFWVDYLSSRGILKRLEDLQDPSINLRAALTIYNYAHSRHGEGWGPWRA